jgi:hypothetical protein
MGVSIFESLKIQPLKSPFPQQQICKEEKEGRAAYALSAFVEFKEIALCCLLAAA